jgi:nucleoid-associated protein YgaU
MVKPGQTAACHEIGTIFQRDEGIRRRPPPLALAPRSVESRRSLESAIGGPLRVPGMRIDPTAPAAAAVTDGNQTGAVASQQRRQITVREGDTLETIAVRYLGS